MRCERSNFRGFTLLELVMVMAVLAIVAGAVAPSLRGFGVARQASNTADLIVGLANYAQTQAISEGRTYRLNFDPSGRAFWLTAQDNGGFSSPDSDYGNRFDVPQGMELKTDLSTQEDGQYVEFRASGRTTPAAITLVDSQGGRIDIASLSATEPFRILKPEEVRSL